MISLAPVPTTKREEKDTAVVTSGGRQEECRLLSVSLELELQCVCKENTSLAAAINEYKVQLKSWEGKTENE